MKCFPFSLLKPCKSNFNIVGGALEDAASVFFGASGGQRAAVGIYQSLSGYRPSRSSGVKTWSSLVLQHLRIPLKHVFFFGDAAGRRMNFAVPYRRWRAPNHVGRAEPGPLFAHSFLFQGLEMEKETKTAWSKTE